MARATRDARLDTRAARDKLKAGNKRHWRPISKGLALGYRKGATGGTWYARLFTGGKHTLQSLGKADDHQDANGIDVLDYFQAQEKARQFADEYAKRKAGADLEPYSVGDALDDYLEWFQANRKSYASTKQACDLHIRPEFGSRPLADLTTTEIRKWHQNVAKAPPRARTKAGATKPNVRKETNQRARQATANRLLTILKAALNHAWHDGRAGTDEPWRKVKPFRNVDAPRIRYLTEGECTRLVNAAASDLRQLVQGALFTGARYGELVRLRVEDFHPDAGTIHVAESKSGKSRHVPLNAEGRAFFERLVAGRKRKEAMFLRADGLAWGQSHQIRPMTAACTAAKIDPPMSFHGLRHTYGAALAMRGVPLQVIAAALGHADTRITERHYAHLMPSYVADTIRANLPALGAWQPDNVEPIGKSRKPKN